MSINKVTQILMERDGLSFEEATDMVHEVLEAASDLAGGEDSVWEAACAVGDYVCGELGIDPDYLTEIVDFI